MGWGVPPLPSFLCADAELPGSSSSLVSWGRERRRQVAQHQHRQRVGGVSPHPPHFQIVSELTNTTFLLLVYMHPTCPVSVWNRKKHFAPNPVGMNLPENVPFSPLCLGTPQAVSNLWAKIGGAGERKQCSAQKGQNAFFQPPSGLGKLF